MAYNNNKEQLSLQIVENTNILLKRLMTEVVLATCSTDILPMDTRQAVIAETLQDLLVRVSCYPTRENSLNLGDQ